MPSALRRRAQEQSDAVALTFLRDGERDEVRWDHAELDRRARRVAARLQADGVAPGAHALLIYPPGLDYVAAFFGCLYAGVIAVPAHPLLLNRLSSQLSSFIADATPALALTSGDLASQREPLVVHEPALGTLPWCATDALAAGTEERAMNTGEPVRAQTLRRFADAFAPAGFRLRSLYPCYGLAESTVMVSGPDPTSRPQVAALAALQADTAVPAGARSDAHELVACGHQLPGHRVVVADPETRTTLSERRVGEVWVHGPSVAQSYGAAPAATEETFRARLADGDRTPFMRTGDLGFLDGGQIHVAGRLKDTIVVRGRNHYPQDGIKPDAIVLIERVALPKTSSGKQRRRAVRELFLHDELQVVAPWRTPRARRAVTGGPGRRRRTIVLTGASGVVGKALLPELVDEELICLVNRGTLAGDQAVVRADVTQPRLGLERADYEDLVRRADCVIHAAAVTDWAAPTERIRSANVEGTRNVLELARAARAPLYHLSTAFVAALSPNAPLALPPEHIIVDYVASKRDAERLVRDSGLPVTIIRPTNLIGDSHTGEIARNQIVQQVIGFVCRGKVPLFPTRREALLDIVPQDVVAKAVAGLVRDGETGGDYWLAYGERTFTVLRALELCVDLMDGIGRPVQLPRIVDPDALDAESEAIESLASSARAFFARLLELSEGMTACGVFPSDMEALTERYDLRGPSLEEAYLRGLARWAHVRGIHGARAPVRSA